MEPLISPEQLLADHRANLRVCDMRWDLTDGDKGRLTYRAGHIPDAVFVDLDTDLAAPPGDNGRHPLPPVDEFAATLGRLGIDRSTHIVVYDDNSGRIAARLWWMLRSIGHEEVQVLDGGLTSWIDAGGRVETGDVSPAPVVYQPRHGYTGVATHSDLDGRTVIDARALERYRGDFEPVDPKAGHIPGAINIPTGHNLGDDGRFHDRAALNGLYDGLPGDVVVSCGSGVTACHDALAMVAAGRAMPDVYVGSFSEWSRLDLRVATGPNP